MDKMQTLSFMRTHRHMLSVAARSLRVSSFLRWFFSGEKDRVMACHSDNLNTKHQTSEMSLWLCLWLFLCISSCVCMHICMCVHKKTTTTSCLIIGYKYGRYQAVLFSPQAFAEMQEAFDGWCSFSKLCLGHFRCIRPTSFGLYVFNLTSRHVKVCFEDGWELLYLCWQVESGKHGGRGWDVAGGGRDGKIVYESCLIWEKKEKWVLQTPSRLLTKADEMRGKEGERKRKKGQVQEGEWERIETERQKKSGVWGRKASGGRQNNVLVKVETKREEELLSLSHSDHSCNRGLFNRGQT